MMQKSRSMLTPTKLRMVLIFSLAIIALVGIAGSFILKNYLTTLTSQVSKERANVALSSDRVNQLLNTEKILNNNKDAIDRASRVVGDASDRKSTRLNSSHHSI